MLQAVWMAWRQARAWIGPAVERHGRRASTAPQEQPTSSSQSPLCGRHKCGHRTSWCHDTARNDHLEAGTQATATSDHQTANQAQAHQNCFREKDRCADQCFIVGVVTIKALLDTESVDDLVAKRRIEVGNRPDRDENRFCAPNEELRLPALELEGRLVHPMPAQQGEQRGIPGLLTRPEINALFLRLHLKLMPLALFSNPHQFWAKLHRCGSFRVVVMPGTAIGVSLNRKIAPSSPARSASIAALAARRS